MASAIEVKVPDIGGFKDVNVIDVLVKDGQQIEKETPLVTIETEKAAMDVPAPSAGKIAQVKLKTGDKVSEGSLILLLEPAAAEAAPAKENAAAPAAAPSAAATSAAATSAAATSAAATSSAASSGAAPSAAPTAEAAPKKESVPASSAAAPATAPSAAPTPRPVDEKAFSQAHASPSVRKFARELGAYVGRIHGTGVKVRFTEDDVKAHVQGLLAAAATAAPVSALPRVPVVDFAHFGEIEVKPLSRIQKISGARLQASWLNLPHVTQHEDEIGRAHV